MVASATNTKVKIFFKTICFKIMVQDYSSCMAKQNVTLEKAPPSFEARLF